MTTESLAERLIRAEPTLAVIQDWIAEEEQIEAEIAELAEDYGDYFMHQCSHNQDWE